MRRAPASALIVGVVAFLAAAVDLATKVAVVAVPGVLGTVVLFNPNRSPLWLRLVVCAGTIAVVGVLDRLARWRGVGPIRLVWAGAGVAVGGVLAQGASAVIWAEGVPDFIWMGEYVMNVADFEIALGLLLGIASVLGYSLRALGRGK